MRLTELWHRLERTLGPTYARSWAADHVLAGLGGRTVEQAISGGVETVVIWRAVHAELELPARER